MYKARDKNTGKLVALKKTRLEVRARGGAWRQLQTWERAAQHLLLLLHVALSSCLPQDADGP